MQFLDYPTLHEMGGRLPEGPCGERPLDWAVYRSDQDKIDILEAYEVVRVTGPRQEVFPLPESGSIPVSTVAVARNVRLLLESSPPAYDQRGCFTCHNNTLPASAAAAAREKGVSVNEDLVEQAPDDILAILELGTRGMMQGNQAWVIVSCRWVMP